jgi:hypothetical protein
LHRAEVARNFCYQVSMTGIRSPRSMKIVERCGTMRDAAGEQARNMAMVRVRKPVNQVGAGRRRNREMTPP